ncbi:MAG TPA: response regulator [Planctomycetota bacterium]|jgi:CheY-like chemotaxis protein|nr:response regulator [Planctomycetota bacterium]
MSIEILIVEDSLADVRLTRRALQRGHVQSNVHVVRDGVEAMAFVQRQAQYADAPRPSLILLDLNLPRKDGRAVLAEIKADAALRSIPVVVLTTSLAPEDVRTCYQLHANCFLVKPVDLDGFTATILAIEEFWLSRVKLPPA